MRGGGAHVKEAMERPGNALSWRGPATPSRSRSTPTLAGESDPDPCASGDARLLCKNPNSNVMFGVTVLARQTLLTLALLIEDV